MHRFIYPTATHSLHTAARTCWRWCLLAFALLCWGLSAPVFAATQTQCYTANIQGADGPIDYGAYCWIDFTPLNLTQAKSTAGQDFQVNLQGGATLTFTLKITPLTIAGNNMYAVSVPSWSGAAFGNSAFNNITGNPILYQDENNQTGPQDRVTLQNVTLNDNGTSNLPFVFVAADGESSNTGESLQFTTSGSTWQLVATPGESNPNRTTPGLAGVGSATVTETGVDGGSDGTASYVFATNTSPGTVTATLKGNGLQGALFGVKYHTVGLSIEKTHVGDFIAGGSGTYNITVTNARDGNTPPLINPPDDPQIVQVVDTLPTGLTYASYNGGGDWSCSAVGQVVTCNTVNPVDLTNGGITPSNVNLPSITLNVNVAANAPATLTNNAAVQINTTALVFNVCGVPNNGVCAGSATSSTGDPTNILHPDLSTSTKSASLPTSNGDYNPGDVVTYTINIPESNGVAINGVSVVDDMPADVGNLTLISIPTGSNSSNTTTTGGANGTGQVNITNISVPAHGNVQIKYSVTINSSATPGTLITNTATVTNPDPEGAGATPGTTITVALSQVPSIGNKVLYVYTSNNKLSRTPQTSNDNAYISRSDTQNWTLAPALAKALTLPAHSDITVSLLVRCRRQDNNNNWTRDCRNNDDTDWTAALYYDSVSPANRIATSNTGSFNNDNYTAETVTMTIGNNDVTIPTGSTLILQVSNPNSNDNRRMYIEQTGNGNDRSFVTLNVSPVIHVDSVKPYTDATCATPATQTYTPGSTVYLCAVVSDPFGSFDIDPATNGVAPTITIKDAGGTTQLNATNMPFQADSGADTKTFAYTYTLPTTAATGYWTSSVTATEGQASVDALYNGGTTITHTANGAFDVETPDLAVTKSVQVLSDPTGSSTPHALPGAIVEYSITVQNNGQGSADADSIKLTDLIDSNVAYLLGTASFTDGTPSSGLSLNLTSGVKYCSNATAGCTAYTSGVGNGNPDPAIRKVIFTPTGTLNGKANAAAPAPNFVIKYQAKLQ